MNFAFIQEAYGIPSLMKNLGSILITSGGVMLGLSHLVGDLVDFPHLDFSCVVLFRSYLRETKAPFHQFS